MTFADGHVAHGEMLWASKAHMLLADVDTLHLSADIQMSDAVRAKLDHEKAVAQSPEMTKTAHCPEWLGAQVHPHGSRGGYVYLLETDHFSVKVLGKGIPHRPGLYVELRSRYLHTHSEGAPGACEEALCWLREQLLYDQDAALVQASCTFETVRLSRVDLHADWQGGWVPSAELGEGLQFIKPARVTWQAYHDGATFTGFVFGSGAILAPMYNKSLQARQRHDDAYAALVRARNPDAFDPTSEVWRLEFQLRREGTTGFRLYAEPDADDDEATIEAELAAEELPHLGTLPRFFRVRMRCGAISRHIGYGWSRMTGRRTAPGGWCIRRGPRSARALGA
jgi:hypothetical protein